MTRLMTARMVVACIALVGLAGCAAQEDKVSDLTVQQAKSLAQAGEIMIAEAVPGEFATEVVQSEQGSLLSCDGERNYRWAGHTRVYVADGAHMKETTKQAAEALAENAGWGVEQDIDSFGDPRLTVASPDGVGFIVNVVASSERRISISSFSPCFHLPEGESPLGDF